MTSEHFLTENKFNPKIFALQNLKFNSDPMEDLSINILNCDNAIIKTDSFKIFDKKFGNKNIVTMNNVNYKSLNEIHRQSLVERDSNKIKFDFTDNLKIDDSGKFYEKSLGTQLSGNNSQLTSETIDETVIEFNEDKNHFQSLNLIEPINFIQSSESKTTNPTEAVISFEQSINDGIVINDWLLIPFKKIFVFSHWIKNILKQAYQKVCTSYSLEIQIYPEKEVINLPQTQITENNKMLLLLVEKCNYMNQELSEIRLTSETKFSLLVNEVKNLKIVNKKISDDNDELVKELKKLSEKLEAIKINSKAGVREVQSSGGIPPPPPPPPPPLMPHSQITPTNSKIHTPRKSSVPPIEKRPVITMDDLLKVTLRKAPKIDKEKPKASASDPRPVISLEMLQNVKLRSIKQRNQNYKVRSPLGLKNRSRFQNVNLSPIMAGSVSPLSRILSRGESFRRRPRKILTSPRTKEEDDNETQ